MDELSSRQTLTSLMAKKGCLPKVLWGLAGTFLVLLAWGMAIDKKCVAGDSDYEKGTGFCGGNGRKDVERRKAEAKKQEAMEKEKRIRERQAIEAEKKQEALVARTKENEKTSPTVSNRTNNKLDLEEDVFYNIVDNSQKVIDDIMDFLENNADETQEQVIKQAKGYTDGIMIKDLDIREEIVHVPVNIENIKFKYDTINTGIYSKYTKYTINADAKNFKSLIEEEVTNDYLKNSKRINCAPNQLYIYIYSWCFACHIILIYMLFIN
jgi:hypothetical protein